MMLSDNIVQYLLSGLTIGSIYALIALGFNIIYNTTGIINFAQGEFMMLGGMFMVAFINIFHLPIFAGALLSITLVIIIGFLIERIAIRPVKDASVVSLIITTIGISIFIKACTAFVSKDSFTYPPFPGPDNIRIFNASLSVQSLWIMGVACLIMVGLSLFFRFTLLGKAMRACSINREAAHIVGIDVNRMSFLSFGLSALMGAVAGVMITPTTQVSWNRGTELGLKGFCAVILGGLGSGPGAVLGGICLGILETVGNIVLSGYKDAIAFSIMLIIICVRPRGLIGRG
ncbi:MAG: branched-chain amino acid ABC transporter permease [Proteobacteria bacterium]|nr:branched-chain amino acid ABC transporter permease [Pseudomonadota bacterium]